MENHGTAEWKWTGRGAAAGDAPDVHCRVQADRGAARAHLERRWYSDIIRYDFDVTEHTRM